MLDTSSHAYTRIIEALQLEYWRQAIRFTQGLKKMKNIIVPLRPYLWLPLVALLVGLIAGLLLNTH